MKHFKTFVFLLPLSLLFAATGCSDEEMSTGTDGTQEGELHEVEVTFNIEASSSLQTRSKKSIARTGSRELEECLFIPDGTLIPQEEPPRQLISSNNWQQVNDVRIYVFRKNDAGNFVYYKPENKEGEEQDYFFVDAFKEKFEGMPDGQFSIWWGGKKDEDETHIYTIKPLLPNGEYRFLAVARDDAKVDVDLDEKVLSDPSDSWVKGETILEEATLKTSTSSATELLSGCTDKDIPIVVEKPGGFHREIELKRAVAGLLMYVENVPAELVAWETIENTDITIYKDAVYRIDAIGIVNGQGYSKSVRLHDGSALILDTISHVDRALHHFLFLFFKEKYEVENNHYVQTSDNEDHPNSMFLGTFIMPQESNKQGAADEDDKCHMHLYKSLYLVFYHQYSQPAGCFPVQWWPIKISSSEKPDSCYFPIEANHFYSLGERIFSKNGTELVTDTPIDLKKIDQTRNKKSDNNLVITVNPD